MLKLLDVFFHLYLIYDCYNDLCILICICFMIVSEIKNKQTNNCIVALNTRVGCKVHRLTMMQWFKLTKCGLLFNIVSPAVHTFLPSVLQGLDSRGTEALTQIFEKKSSTADITASSVRYCFPAKCFIFMLGNRK